MRRSRPSAGKARPNVPLGTGGQFACSGHTYESPGQKLGLSLARPKGLGHSRGYFISFLIKYLTGSNLTDSVHLLDIFSLWSNLSQKALRSSTYSLLTPLVATVCSSLTYWLRRDLFLRNVVTIKTEVLLWCDSVRDPLRCKPVKPQHIRAGVKLFYARPKGLEPSTSRVTGECSIQLSYGRSGITWRTSSRSIASFVRFGNHSTVVHMVVCVQP